MKGGREKFLRRNVERQGIGQTRSSRKHQASSVIWRMILAEKVSGNTHLGVICTHPDPCRRGKKGNIRAYSVSAEENWPSSPPHTHMSRVVTCSIM